MAANNFQVRLGMVLEQRCITKGMYDFQIGVGEGGGELSPELSKLHLNFEFEIAMNSEDAVRTHTSTFFG